MGRFMGFMAVMSSIEHSFPLRILIDQWIYNSLFEQF